MCKHFSTFNRLSPNNQRALEDAQDHNSDTSPLRTGFIVAVALAIVATH